MDVPRSTSLPYLGYGLGLRTGYYEEILQHKPKVDWFEILSENYLVAGGKPLYYLDKIREHYPVVMHGVSMSIGSMDVIDMDYLKQLKQLANRVDPIWVSDHLCWTGVSGKNLHDLLPMPYTNEAIKHIVSRVQLVQEFLGRPLLLENVSSYLTFQQSEMREWEFLVEIVKLSGCYILLDINNVFVSSVNHQFDPHDYLNALPKEKIAQIHLAGHQNHGDYIIDTHDTPIIQEVWALYAATIKKFGSISTMIERDDHMPPFAELLAELKQAQQIAEHALESECVA